MSTQPSATQATQNSTQPLELEAPKFWEWGWNRSAEIWNGRLAMLLFLGLILFAWTLA